MELSPIFDNGGTGKNSGASAAVTARMEQIMTNAFRI